MTVFVHWANIVLLPPTNASIAPPASILLKRPTTNAKIVLPVDFLRKRVSPPTTNAKPVLPVNFRL